MSSTSRREFIRQAALTSGIAAAAPAVQTALARSGPNERINVAVVGFHGRGRAHYREFAKIAGVRVAILCDVDERLFPEAVAEVEKLTGYRPKTEFDFRRLLDNKEIDAISIATPDHWHGLMTVWACQAGKDVYVEKPVCYSIEEGRKMVEAARKHDRVVQAGLNMRSDSKTRLAVQFLKQGKLGSVYRSKAIIFKGRAGIGHTTDSGVPAGVHWDLFLGPAPYRPFNLNRFHYGWHFFWETSTSDMGNSGVHQIDLARWGMNKYEHPVKVHCAGGLYLWDSDQETPNLQSATFEYADGTLMEVELSNLYTPQNGGVSETGNLFFTSEGYITSAEGWKTFRGQFAPRTPDISSAGVSERVTNVSFPKRTYTPGPVIEAAGEERAANHFQNFIDCVRSRKWQDLHSDILEGHMSTALCHMANISYLTGRKLVFDPKSERFVGDEEANRYLTRKYREPFVLPQEV